VIISVACLVTAQVDPQQRPAAGDGISREKRFVVIGGEGVPEYDDSDVPYDYDVDLDDVDDVDDVDVDHDGPGYHHVWWHHFYHHGEPHLPFPLFPPTFVHRRPLYHSCDQWPFPCTTSYEVIRWLQCYYEYIAATGVKSWKK